MRESSEGDAVSKMKTCSALRTAAVKQEDGLLFHMDVHKTCIGDHRAISFSLGKLHNFLLHLLATVRTEFEGLYLGVE